MPTRTRAGTVLDLALDALGARKSAFLAAALLDRPVQAGLDGRRGGVDVMAIEAEPGFEAQRIARAEADRLDLRIGEKRAPELRGIASHGMEIS